ncbi:carbohydrate ABC transporter permease [Phytoactinopolyspora limicola]|uniref:carbohydrate ABC transporter permease n=1 Tax=Phytoactinopolyspora limicola TaxID=2715536 RepID=UPI001A9C886B|nr:sugar ABC transporter permease [Phytoactinopolyspora limicola]
MTTDVHTGTPAAPGRTRRPAPARPSERRWAAIFLSPAMLVIGIFMVVPILLTVWISLHEWSMFTSLGDMTWRGLDNYAGLWSDAGFRNSLRNTVLYVLLVVVLTIPLSVLLGLLLYFPTMRGKAAIRTALFATYVVPTVAIAMVWGALYAPTYGPFDQILGAVGITGIGWLSSPDTALISLVVFHVWQMIGYYTVLVVAGLTQIPGELYEAARVDGAGFWRQTTSLTLPMLGRTMTFVVLIAVVNAIQVFDPIYILTQGGPAGSTEVLSFTIQRTAFEYGLAGQASAMAFSLFLLMVAVGAALMVAMRRRR